MTWISKRSFLCRVCASVWRCCCAHERDLKNHKGNNHSDVYNCGDVLKEQRVTESTLIHGNMQTGVWGGGGGISATDVVHACTSSMQSQTAGHCQPK